MAVVVCQASSDLVCPAGSADTCWRLIVVPKLPAGGDGQVVSVADPPWVFVDIVVLEWALKAWVGYYYYNNTEGLAHGWLL